MPNQQKNLQLIQMLRGIASVLVVLLHITINFSGSLNRPFLFDMFKFGGSGVDIFFVLSGFIITYSNRSILSKPSMPGWFLKRRFTRIFPIYWIVITVFLLLQLAFASFYTNPFDWSFKNLLSTFLLLPGHVMVNGVSWSLTNELFFYLLFTLAIIIPSKKTIAFIGAVYFLLVLLLSVTGYSTGNPYLSLVIFPMNIEFLLGVLIALTIDKLPKGWLYTLFVAGIFIFGIGAFYRNNDLLLLNSNMSEGLDRVILFGFPSFLIIAALVKWELSNNVKVKNIFLQLGDASYSIYLVHLPIVAAFYKIIAKMQVKNNGLIYLLTILLLVGVCFLGIMIYHKIEKPLIKKLNQVLLRKQN
jgi:exopolysaccharide production protein ExoZ